MFLSTIMFLYIPSSVMHMFVFVMNNRSSLLARDQIKDSEICFEGRAVSCDERTPCV